MRIKKLLSGLLAGLLVFALMPTFNLKNVNATDDTVIDLEWSGDCSTVHEQEFDLGEYLPDDVAVKSVNFKLVNILSGCTPTYSNNFVTIKLITRTFDEPTSDIVSITVATENHGDYIFNIKISLTGKYIVDINAKSLTGIYDGTTQHLGYSNLTGKLKNGSNYEGDYSFKYFKEDGTPLDSAPVEVGEYYVEISIPESNENYKGSQKVLFEIVKEVEASYQTSENGEWISGSFTGALANTYVGGTIKLLKNINLDSTITIDKKVTITSDDSENPKMITSKINEHGYLLKITDDVKFENIIIDGGSKSDITATRALIAVGDNTNSGKLTLGDGTVIQNNNNTTSNGGGGAICVLLGDLTIDGGSIINNQASNVGGAIYLASSNASFKLSEGLITENNAAFGGGIYVNLAKSLELLGGSITKNTADKWGAGLLIAPDSKVVLSDNIFISDNNNLSEEPGDNMYVDGYEYNGIHMPTIVIDELNESAKIEMYSWLKSKTGEELLFASPEEGYTITVSDLKKLSYEDEAYMLTLDDNGDLVLTDMVEYTVTFNTNDGSSIEPVKVQKDLTLDKPSNPTKDGYVFGGWYDGDTAYDFNTLITSNLTLSAKWLEEESIIHVNIDKPVIDGDIPTTASIQETGFNLKGLIWKDENRTPVTGKFVEGKTYTVIVSLECGADSATSNDLNVFVNGELLSENVQFDSTTVLIEYTFETLKKPVTNYPTYIPTVKDEIEVDAEHVHDGEDIHAEVVKTNSEIKEFVGKKNTVTTIKLEETDHPVEVTIDLGKKYEDEIIYVLNINEENGEIELTAAGKTDEDGVLVFETQPTDELTLTTSLPSDFCSQGEVVEAVTYYVTEDGELYKGWLEHEDHWHFFDYKNAKMKKNYWQADGIHWYCFKDGVMIESSWIAKDSTGSIWYYVDAEGRLVRNVWIDGYYIDANGEWHK